MSYSIRGGSNETHEIAYEAANLFDWSTTSGVHVSIELVDGHIIQAGKRTGFGVFDWPKRRGCKALKIQIAALPLPGIPFKDWAYGFKLNILHELMHVKQYLTGRKPNESWATRWAKRALAKEAKR